MNLITGVKVSDYLSLKDLQKMEETRKTMSHILTINSQILNDLIKDCHPQAMVYLRNFMIGHNSQVTSLNYFTQELNKMFIGILKEADTE